MDNAGNLYIADTGNHRIRKVDADGAISTVAGTGTEGFSGDGGPATAAQLRSPSGVATDDDGNLYIADTRNQRIRKVGVYGNISTAAGGMHVVDGNLVDDIGDGGPAIEAQLIVPRDVAADGEGNIYIADSMRIRRVDAAGNISTFAGTWPFGYSGDGGPAAEAQLGPSLRVTADRTGNIYIADGDNDRIRKVDADGIITTVAGNGDIGDGGPATAAQLRTPFGVAVDGASNIYIADRDDNRIRKVGSDGGISTVAGAGRLDGLEGEGIPATAALLWNPRSVAVDAEGSVYIADTSSHRIRKVGSDGNIATFAGTGRSGTGLGTIFYDGDGSSATQAHLYFPRGVATDGAGNVYIADTRHHIIRKVDANGNIFTIAGYEFPGYSGDGGPATEAELRYPRGMAADTAGNIYIADAWNHRIRKVNADGIIDTFAGTGTIGYSGDGGPAAAAQLNNPYDVAVDEAGNVYIADSFNRRIRKVDSGGNIATIAGGGSPADGIGDGGPATAAQLRGAYGVAVDSAGNVYIAEAWNHRVRRLTPAALPEKAPRISAGGIVLATGTPTVDRISPNALISVFGQDFAPQGTQTLSPVRDAEGRIAVNLNETCLEIGGRRAPLFVVTPSQINAQAPHDLPPGETQAAVVRGCGAGNEQRGESVTVTAAAVSPAFFNVLSNPDGRNPLVALHGGGPALAGAPGLLPEAEFSPAVPGEFVTLFGTGFGAVEPPLESGQIPGAAANLANAIAFTVSSTAVPPEDVLYAGASPCCAGLYQFTLRVPPDTPDGDAAVEAIVDGVSTPQGPFLTVRRSQ